MTCFPDYSTSHTFGNGFWSNCLRGLIRNGFWCCFSTDEQIYLATLKPSVSQIGGSSMGEVSLWQMPAALRLNRIDYTSGCLQLYHTTWHNLFVSLPPTFYFSTPCLFWVWLCSCDTNFIIWVKSSLSAKQCFAEMWLLSRRLHLSHLVLLFRSFDLIPASVVLFVLLLFPRILLLSLVSEALPSAVEQVFLLAQAKASNRLQMDYPADNCCYSSNQGDDCGNIVYDLEVGFCWLFIFIPRFKKIFCG